MKHVTPEMVAAFKVRFHEKPGQEAYNDAVVAGLAAALEVRQKAHREAIDLFNARAEQLDKLRKEYRPAMDHDILHSWAVDVVENLKVIVIPPEPDADLRRPPAPSPVGESRDARLPDDIIERLLAVGRVEWGTSLYQADEKHVEDFRDTLRITREHFATEADETAIHGVYLEGTGTVLAHTGNSPNSPQHARILVGAWNQLVDMALAAKEQQP